MHGNTKCKEKIRALFSTGGLKTTLYYQLIPFSMTTPFKSSTLAVVSVLVPCVVSMAQREHEDLKGKHAREADSWMYSWITHGPASVPPTPAFLLRKAR